MPFNINDFQARISKTGGVALSSYFDVQVVVPNLQVSTSLGDQLLDQRELSFRIDSIDVPTRSVQPIEYRLYGPEQKVGGRAVYSDITLTCILSPDMRERNFFLAWQDSMVGPHRRGSNNLDDIKRQYNIGYYDEYARDSSITIRQFVETLETPVYEIKLIECIPTTIPGPNLNWGNPDVIRQNVSIAYRHFEDKFLLLPDVANQYASSIISRINQSGLGGLINTAVGQGLTNLPPQIQSGISAVRSVLPRVI